MNVSTIIFSVFILLIVNVMSIDLYSCFTIPKLVVLRFGGLALFLAWIYNFKKSRLRMLDSKIQYLALGFFCLLLMSTTLSLHLPSALQGTYNVYEGFWTHMLYLLLFLMGATLPIDRIAIVRMSVHAITILSLYALYQYLGYDIMFQTNGRPISFTGNAVAMAGVISLALLLSIYLAVQSKGIGRAYWTFITYLFFFVISASLTRGAVLGSIAATGIMAITLFKHISKKVLFGGLALAMLIMLLAVIHSPSSDATKRYSSPKADGSVNLRLQYWQVALQMIKDHPLLGVGPDNFINAYPSYRTVELDTAERNTSNSKAHNGYLQMAATMGLPALIVYFGLVIASIKLLLKSKKNRLLAMAFIASIIGYMIQDITGWEEFGITPIFYVILGLSINNED